LRRRVREQPARRLTARIEKIGAQGDGVARGDGWEVFTPLTAPGDLAVIEARGRSGKLIELIESGPDRAAAPCAHYGICGGCALQHVNLAFQRRWKRERIVEALAAAGLDAPVSDSVATLAASRRRATFAVRKSRDGALLGFNARRSSEVVDISGCLVLEPKLVEKLSALRSLAATIPAREFDLAATLCENGLDVHAIGDRIAELNGRERVLTADAARNAGCVRLSVNHAPIVTFAPPVIHIDGLSLAPGPGAFLQASRDGEGALIALVKEACAGAARIADLFSGCGTFSLPLARTASVLAVDSDKAGLEALGVAVRQAQSSGIALKSVQTEMRDLIERPLTGAELKNFEAIVFDPPRAGAKEQAHEIANARAPVVVGVSCNPATFARDARMLADGGYTLSQVTPIDQFVYSPHVELIGVFRRKR